METMYQTSLQHVPQGPRRRKFAVFIFIMASAILVFLTQYYITQHDAQSTNASGHHTSLLQKSIPTPVTHSFLTEPVQVANADHPDNPYISKRRIFHLDLKGAPPKISYLRKLFPLLKIFGATGILLEYEEMFPYEGALAMLGAKNRYSKEDVKAILQLAKEQEFEVIPLVQTFSHLEFLLKHPQHRRLREVPNMPQTVCPSNNKTMAVLEDMIDQVIALHPDIQWLHIGSNEVHQLGLCSKCMLKSLNVLFLSHVTRVASYVRTQHNVTPIVWDDEFHYFNSKILNHYNLGNLVEIMMWNDMQNVYRIIPDKVWDMFAEIFPYVWSAGTFKDTTVNTVLIPNVESHLKNNLEWLEVMTAEQSRFKEVRGIVLTGWQKHEHFSSLGELLPASVPSLALNLMAVSRGYFDDSWVPSFYEGLQCTKLAKFASLDLDLDPYLFNKSSRCSFPGAEVFDVAKQAHVLCRHIDYFLKAIHVSKPLNGKALPRDFNSNQQASNSLSTFDMQEKELLLERLEQLIRHSRSVLLEVYDEYTVVDWIEQKLYPQLRKFKSLP